MGDDEGLRERKKRETRQKISDIATELFIERGFDEVKISEIAEAVGVSEKTVYNYFPTKEALVFDRAEEQLRKLTQAVRERESGTSPVWAFVGSLKQELEEFLLESEDPSIPDYGSEDDIYGMRAFGEMVRTTPALQAAWGEHRHRLVEALTQVLAANYRIDPREAEIVTAARGVVSLVELLYDSQLRHAEDGLQGRGLADAVARDLDRGARLIETGLWSMRVLVERREGFERAWNQFGGRGPRGPKDPFGGRGPRGGSPFTGDLIPHPGHGSEDWGTGEQWAEFAAAAEAAREQVTSSLKDAKDAWKQFRDDAVAAGRELRDEAKAAQDGDYSYVRDLARQRAEELRARALEIAQAQREAAREAAKAQRDFGREAGRAARDSARADAQAAREAKRAAAEAAKAAERARLEAERRND